MSLVWELDLPDSEKLVLLALADCANDEGHCWPGMSTLQKKCSKSDRTIQAAIQTLCAKGHLTRREIIGKGCNYTVHPIVRLADPRTGLAPEAISPPKPFTQTPEAVSGKPSRTIKASEAKASSAKRAAYPPPPGVPSEVWSDYLKLRERKRAAMSATAYSRQLAKLQQLAETGYPPGEVVALSVERGWTGFFEVREDERYGRTNTMGRHQPADGLSSTARAAIAVFGR
jgi:hypothetical protein